MKNTILNDFCRRLTTLTTADFLLLATCAYVIIIWTDSDLSTNTALDHRWDV